MTHKKAGAFSLSGRSRDVAEKAKQNASPGPGAYSLPPIGLNRANGVSFSPRFSEKTATDFVPGPGAYDSSRWRDPKSGPSYSLSGPPRSHASMRAGMMAQTGKGKKKSRK